MRSTDRNWLAMAGVLVLIGAVSARGFDHGAAKPARASGEKILLLETDRIARSAGTRLVLGTIEKDPHNPLFAEDRPWEPRFDNLYANVLFDAQERLYKCWYSPFIIDEATRTTPAERRLSVTYFQALKANRPREMGVCYARSKDGIHWHKPALGIIAFAGSKANNVVARGPHGAGVRKDLHDPNPRRRYKMFYCGGARTMSVAFSPDGIHWSAGIHCPTIEAAGDTHNNAFWSDRLGKYVGITRLWAGQRLVGRTESADFVHWTKAVEVFRGSQRDQTYAMPVFKYARVYLGLAMVFHTDVGTVDCELAWSRDTVHWHRVCPGTPLIPRGPPGSCDSGCIFAAACPIVGKDEIRIYYGGNNGPHNDWRDGFFCLARLRRDRFAGLTTTSQTKAGRVTTRPIRCTGRRLQVTADVKQGGSLRVAVANRQALRLDQCVPMTASTTDGTVAWQGGHDLTALRGKAVELRFELKSATLYAFRFVD